MVAVQLTCSYCRSGSIFPSLLFSLHLLSSHISFPHCSAYLYTLHLSFRSCSAYFCLLSLYFIAVYLISANSTAFFPSRFSLLLLPLHCSASFGSASLSALLSLLFSLLRLMVQLTSLCCSAVLSLYCPNHTVDRPAVQEGDPLLQLSFCSCSA